MNNDENIPVDLRFQRYAHERGLDGQSSPEGQVHRRGQPLSPEAFTGIAGNKTVAHSLYDRLKALGALLRG